MQANHQVFVPSIQHKVSVPAVSAPLGRPVWDCLGTATCSRSYNMRRLEDILPYPIPPNAVALGRIPSPRVPSRISTNLHNLPRIIFP